MGARRAWRKSHRKLVAPERSKKDRALAGVPDKPRNTTMSLSWMARPGAELPKPALPTADPFDDGDGGWWPVR